MHHGIDPVGIARAVLSFSSRGGGSTITQQVRLYFGWLVCYAYHVFDGFINQVGFVCLFVCLTCGCCIFNQLLLCLLMKSLISKERHSFMVFGS